ncbi:putative GNAT family acetyltransferase [Arthrobacter sp. PL16]|uniref:GNAT family N-acetyltransferase n=1 Tax=Arthrobacter sp. PL16 TaxID=3071720 RepID=UPI002DF984DB|nr:putative GNAT family acetyltransferase [Arthrobacter sp. PL16]
MMNPLHPTQTAPLPALVPDVSDALPQDTLPQDALSLAAGDAAQTQEPDSAALDEALSADDLEALSTRQLRVMANQAYRLMDTSYPPYGAADRYEMLVEELEYRARQATERGTATQTRNRPREAFRNNALYCRFELFIDGSLAAFLKYTMDGGQVVLLDGAEQPGFRDQGVDAILMRHAVLNIHKRRLNLVPQCPMAFSFLADNPEYRILIAQPRQ